MKVQFIVGPHASGKTYSSKEALKNEELSNVKIIDTGPIIREIHSKVAPELSIGEWIDNLEKQYGDNISDEIISNEIKRRLNDDDKAIIIGYRTLKGINYVLDKIKPDDYQILYLDASLSLLYKNYIERTKNNISIEEFKKYIEEEYNSGLNILKEECFNGNSNFQYIYKKSNEDSFETILIEFFGKHKNLYKKIEQKEIKDE